ncbi:MAG: dynamin family protein [Myxococcales bacterium]|nr:dynamin family protein [Myxococcales bacterium]
MEGGDRLAARPLFDAALDDRDPAALSAALQAVPAEDPDPAIADARRVAAAAAKPAGDLPALDELARVTQPRLVPWAEALAADVARSWLPASGVPADWTHLLARLDTHARALADLDSVAALSDLAAERAHPLRLAIVGEFNAGKSTFINALIGADVAPTGVLPTTATLHHLRWAPDPIARVFFADGHEPPERIVPLADLRATLRSLEPDLVRRVELLLPLEFLVRVEVLDTPGFNAPDPRHTRVALSAFAEADAAIWLLDATQAFKQSERAVLDEARRAKLPVQLLVNKADRLSAADLERVLRIVDEAVAETRIVSLAPPRALSAKKALAGKLGDAKALEDSGWEATLALLEEQIVSRHAQLKERALRRRAAAIVARLSGQAEAEAERRRVADQGLVERAQAVRHAAARVEKQAEEIGVQLVRSMRPFAEAWSRDLAQVVVGRDRAIAARDPQLTRYRVDRAVAALGTPLARALAAVAPASPDGPGQLLPAARTLVRAAAEATDSPDPDALLPPLVRASVATLLERLFALAEPPPPAPGAAGLVRELRAFAAALAAAE